MEAKDQTFADTDIVVDGNEYRGCRFERCKIVYRGGDLPLISGCNFQDCGWQFEEGAERTLMLMKMLYHGMGDRGAEMIESTMTMIRQPFTQTEATSS